MKKLLFFILFLLFPAIVYAQPSISSASGTFSKGNTVTITGSSFGSHADYHDQSNSGLAYAWRDFEEGAINGYGWTAPVVGSRQNWDIVSGGINRTNSSYFAKRDNYGGANDNTGGLQKPASGMNSWATNTSFVSFWYYAPSTKPAGKVIRFRFVDVNSNDWWCSWDGNAYDLVYRGSDTTGSSCSNLSGADSSCSSYRNSSNEIPTGAWYRIDLLFVGNRQQGWIIGRPGWLYPGGT
jgi:hypothetical protein